MAKAEDGLNAQQRYIKRHMRIFNLRVNRSTEPDILERILREPNFSGFIKNLIREQIAREKAGKAEE